VIVEYAPHGNLREFLREFRGVAADCSDDMQQLQHNVSALSYKDLLSFAFQVARGLEYMASQMVPHVSDMILLHNVYDKSWNKIH